MIFEDSLDQEQRIRSESIKHAIDYASAILPNTKVGPEGIIEFAQRFERYIEEGVPEPDDEDETLE